MKKKFFIVFFLIVFISACSSFKKYEDTSIGNLYSYGLYYFNKQDLDKAKTYFLKIVEEYPFREEAIEAQVYLIWIYYINNNTVELETSIDSYLKYYTANEYMPWVKYMQAISYYDQMQDHMRDSTSSNNAFLLFKQIADNKINSNSQYSKDAKIRLEVVKYFLSKKNIDIARYYLERKEYIAAIGRYKDTIDYYQDTPFIGEAMYYLVYLWLSLGVEEEAFRIAVVLGYNYPESIWYSNALKLIKDHTNYNDNTTLITTRE